MGDFVLNREDVGQVTIVAIGPHMPTVLPMNKLPCDPHARAGLSNASFQNKIDSKIFGHFLDFYRFGLVGEGCVACHHEQTGHLREVGNDILRDPIAEIFLFRIATHVDERENRDRWLLFAVR